MLSSPSNYSLYTKASLSLVIAIISFIIASVDRMLRAYLLKFPTAASLWNHLISQYVQSSGARKYQLLVQSFAAKQENRTIQEFHTQMREFWRELQQLEGTGPDSNASRAFQDCHQLFMFLMALRSEYQPIYGQIIHKNPIPSLGSAVSDLIAEEIRLHSLSTLTFTLTS